MVSYESKLETPALLVELIKYRWKTTNNQQVGIGFYFVHKALRVIGHFKEVIHSVITQTTLLTLRGLGISYLDISWSKYW